MGDPKKPSKKYSGPSHPWQKTRIEEEKKLLKEYGLRNKKELWKMESKRKNLSDQAKSLIGQQGSQAEKQKEQLFGKLQRLGIINTDAKLDDLLGLNVKDLLERRLQTMVFRKGMAKSMNQSRQFITHQHVAVTGQKMSSPAYLVLKEEESGIGFLTTSTLSNPDHPEREIKKIPEAEKETEKEKTKNERRKN